MSDYNLLQRAIQASALDLQVVNQLNDLVEFFKLFDQLPAGSHLAKRASGQWGINVPITYGWDKYIAATPLETVKQACNQTE